ncbi:DUF5615 family PIN-like protein [Mucilaginibacter celer]|uniref:DUF5615 domain-containing protein n=1 Tax=Mucilaginibacter celer TaxID=2305508 RepID=A0A494VGS5_9SPHI|nr:DUF5615 family PIN-like protein [Mucilaginibacter celer]AYL93776.1 hypothetical protein HYN43_000025 [Mucilaginibacter celer]
MIRLIADENISWRLKELLPAWKILPVNEVKQRERLIDFKIWQYARVNQYLILTLDEEFWDLQNLNSFPPKIIWLRTGNSNTAAIASLLLKSEDLIKQFVGDGESGILELYL